MSDKKKKESIYNEWDISTSEDEVEEKVEVISDSFTKDTVSSSNLKLNDDIDLEIKDVKSDNDENINDAILGLISLGYQKTIVQKVISSLAQKLGPNTSANELIVNALQEIK
jgi:hypothetical protein